MPIPQPLILDPKWFPAIGDVEKLTQFHLDPAGGKVKLRFSPPEKRMLRKRRQISVSQWAERHRYLPRDAAIPGRWKNTTAPYLAGIMDAGFFPSVEEIVMVAAPQTGKTEAVYTCLGYCVDRRPGNVLIVFPTETDSKDNSSDRLVPMFNDSPRLRSYKTGYADDETGIKISLQHMRFYMAWATSASRLANRPLPYVFLDEEDKYPETAGKKEASPADLAKKRTRTFKHMRKIWRSSSPSIEAGPIWKALNKCHLIFDYWVQCPFCGCDQKMVFEQIKWTQGERDPKVIETTRDVWYACEHCSAHWDDGLRNKAVRQGQWRDREKRRPIEVALNRVRPLRIGFHLPAWLSPFVDLWECAAAFLAGLKDKTKLKDFQNGFAALPWKAVSSDRKEDDILALCDQRPEGRVPGNGQVACLVGSADTQDDGFWYEIRAVGYGLESFDSWGIRNGFVTSFEALDQVFWHDQYKDADGNVYPVRLVLQDAMGHRTSEVYNFCLRHRGRILPTQGKQVQSIPVTSSPLEYFPPDAKGRRRPIPGGLQLVKVDTNFFKSQLDGILKIKNSDPGAWLYHADLTVEWARQMTVEGINEKGLWENTNNRPNHGWDCSVLIMAARWLLGVRFWPEPEPKSPEVDPVVASKTSPPRPGSGYRRPQWLENR